MPLYEYECQSCQHNFEKMVSFSDVDRPQPCPQCKSLDTQKQISLFASASTGMGTASTSSTSSCGGGGRFT